MYYITVADQMTPILQKMLYLFIYVSIVFYSLFIYPFQRMCGGLKWPPHERADPAMAD